VNWPWESREERTRRHAEERRFRGNLLALLVVIKGQNRAILEELRKPKTATVASATAHFLDPAPPPEPEDWDSEQERVLARMEEQFRTKAVDPDGIEPTKEDNDGIS
jgi:hypothetical protein